MTGLVPHGPPLPFLGQLLAGYSCSPPISSFPALSRPPSCDTEMDRSSASSGLVRTDGLALLKKRMLVHSSAAPKPCQPKPVSIPPYSRLVTTDETGKRAFPITAGRRSVKIGRNPESDYVIESDKVSVNHCQIYLVSIRSLSRVM